MAKNKEKIGFLTSVTTQKQRKNQLGGRLGPKTHFGFASQRLVTDSTY